MWQRESGNMRAANATMISRYKSFVKKRQKKVQHAKPRHRWKNIIIAAVNKMVVMI
jgi:hypothetical protein